MQPLRFGIFGTGRMAERFVNTFRAGLVTQAVVTAAASAGGGRGKEFARRHGLPRGYDSYEALLCDREIDAVYIANLNDRHDECCRLCFAAGKHVLCEKPMFLHADTARRLIDDARAAGVFLMEAMWTRFTPIFAKATEWVREGRIGQLRNVSASLCAARDPQEFARLYDPALDGGALYDLGVYGIQAAQYFARGHALREARPLSIPAATGVDLATYLHMVFEGGLVGEVKCSIGWHARNEAWLCGERGYIRIAPFYNYAQRAELYTPPFPAASSLEPAKPAEVLVRESPSGLEYEIDHVAHCIQEGLRESPIMPLADSLEIAQVYDRAQELFRAQKEEQS